LVTTTEKIIIELRERILKGLYRPGQHLQEALLASDLEVSRTPIRDALRILSNEELLNYYPNRGYVVRDVELQDVLDAYDVRSTLEGMACRIAAERTLSQELKKRLESIVNKGEAVFTSPEWGPFEQSSWHEINSDFHGTIIEASGNRQLDHMVRQIRRLPRMFDARLNPKTEFFQSVYTRQQRLRAHNEHKEILEALIRGESSRAEALMREHVYRNREALRHKMDESNRTALQTADA